MITMTCISAGTILSCISRRSKTIARQANRLLSSKSNEEITAWRSQHFEEEKARQMSLLGRLHKIEVNYDGVPEPCTMMMNKGISTPYNCAMHIGELITSRSILALVNGQAWDLHKPLEEDCEIKFLHFKDDDVRLVNEAFWRSSAFILGYIAERAFKSNHHVELCSFPKPDITSGSFVYDLQFNLPDWQPSKSELNCLSRIGGQLHHSNLRFERLDVDASVAENIFKFNKFKLAQIPSISASSHTGSKVTLYRLGDHVDISRGPMISSTKHFYRYSVTAIHDIETEDYGTLKRWQGLAIPAQIPTHYWTYEFLCEKAAKLNSAPLPKLGNDPSNVEPVEKLEQNRIS